MQRILIARLSAMGDIVHSLPAVAALRRALPQATIGCHDHIAVDFPLPCDAAAESWADQQINGKEFVLLNPGAGWGAKRWPAERYAEVARTLGGEGLHVLVNCGPGEEAIAQQIA